MALSRMQHFMLPFLVQVHEAHKTKGYLMSFLRQKRALECLLCITSVELEENHKGWGGQLGQGQGQYAKSHVKNGFRDMALKM